ncbi:MAG TPA: hypothetical protein VGK02_09800 [Candidatus Aquicultor sp.]
MNELIASQRARNRVSETHCFICGESRAAVLKEVPFEAHHLIGKREGPTVTICLNCHTIYERKKADWLEELLLEGRTPYQKFIAFLMAITDGFAMLAENFLVYGAQLANSDKDTVIDFPESGMTVGQLVTQVGVTGVIFIKLVQDSITGRLNPDFELEALFNEFVHEHEATIKKLSTYFMET